ncbi:MAG TPA: hypothetical protein VMH81_28835 [Bryobacteraceae bacterium]|nr:hypothetical protein [Bryobacteraceae bacterium]
MGPNTLTRLSGAARNVNILSLDPLANDYAALGQIFSRSRWSLCPGETWTLTPTHTVESALAAMRENQVPILICNCDHQPETWKEVLEALPTLAHPPVVIVTSRTADDRLWAEALNLGVYDVLAQPFDQYEVTRIVSLAWLHWKERSDSVKRYAVAGAGGVS